MFEGTKLAIIRWSSLHLPQKMVTIYHGTGVWKFRVHPFGINVSSNETCCNVSSQARQELKLTQFMCTTFSNRINKVTRNIFFPLKLTFKFQHCTKISCNMMMDWQSQSDNLWLLHFSSYSFLSKWAILVQHCQQFGSHVNCHLKSCSN